MLASLCTSDAHVVIDKYFLNKFRRDIIKIKT